MKRLIIFLALILSVNFTYADTVLQGEAQFDWVDISQVERDTNINYYREQLFGDENTQKYTRKEFKNKYADKKKDSDRITHYIKAKGGIKEYGGANLCAFYYHKDILIIYAVQYKDNLRQVYYYDALGNLRYVDEISENYPNFPYYSKQYTRNGKLISAIYFISKDMQYMYEPNGEFKGLWYKDKMYDSHGKQTVTRSNWGI